MMTTGVPLATAGLIFMGPRELDIASIGKRVGNAFEALEQKVTGVRILAHDRAWISSVHHDVQVRLREDQIVDGLDTPAPVMVELEIADTSADRSATTPRQDTVLAHALKALHWTLSADHVKWVTPGALLSSADFVMATSQPEPAPGPRHDHVSIGRNAAGIVTRHHCILPNIDETNEQIHQRLTDENVPGIDEEYREKLRANLLVDPERIRAEKHVIEDISEPTAPLRLSAWMVSFTVALFALPVGAALLVVNLLKGENLRLSAQAMALTGTFLGLQACGSTAQAMALLQGLVG